MPPAACTVLNRSPKWIRLPLKATGCLVSAKVLKTHASCRPLSLNIPHPVWAKHDSILLTIFHRRSKEITINTTSTPVAAAHSYLSAPFSRSMPFVNMYLYSIPTNFLSPQIPGNGVLGPTDFNASPQAVFTSFKLPKPGGGQPGQSVPPAAAPPPAPVPTPSSAAELLAMAAAGPDFKFSLSGAGGGGGGGGVEKVLSAPLGGLPAMASQGSNSMSLVDMPSKALRFTWKDGSPQNVIK